jgi:hypothetical protein
MSKCDPVRVVSLLSCVALSLVAGPGAAQDVAPDQPIYYANCQYGIAIIFPGASMTPQTRDSRYTIPFYANNLPAREFYIDRGGSHYSVTVVDFSSGPRADEAIVEQAAAELRKKGEVRYQAYADYDPGMPGRQLNIFEPNNRQLRASLYMAYHKLVITPADASVDDNDSIQFEQSIVLVDKDGIDIDRVNAQDGTGTEPLRKFPCR